MSKEQNQHTNPAKMKFYRCCLPLAILSLASMSQGAIIWKTPQNISTGGSGHTTDVSTNGAFVQAYTFTDAIGANPVINDTTFTRTTVTTVEGKHSFAYNSPSDTAGLLAVSFNGGSGNYVATSTEYRPLIAQAMSASGGTLGGPTAAAGDGWYNAYTFTLDGLTEGYAYEIQIWISSSLNTAAGNGGMGHLDRLTDGGVLVDYSVGGSTTGGDIGQYVIGTFTATGPTEFFTFDTYLTPANSTALLNAYQLRDISSVPEPSLTLLGVLGLGGLFLRRRRAA